METLFFLPAWPLAVGDNIWIGIALLGAIGLSEIAHRLLRLPRISGYILAGVLISPLLAQFSMPNALHQIRPIFELAFGLLLFELGQRIDLGWLRRNPWLIAMSLAEWTLAFVGVAVVLTLFNVPPLVTLLTAGATATTGPAVILGVCRDSGARGPVTDRLHLLCGLSNCYGFLVLGAAYAWKHVEEYSNLALTVLHPLYLVFGSVALGAIVALVMLAVTARIKPHNNNQILAATALVFVASAAAEALNMSGVIVLLAAGVLSRTLDRRHRLQPMEFGLLGQIALITVFTATGVLLNPAACAAAFLPALGLLAARALGKGMGLFLFARPSGLSLRKTSLLSIGMLPMSGAALLWIDRTAAIWPDLGAQIAATILTALLFMELLAPPALQFALRRADETREIA